MIAGDLEGAAVTIKNAQAIDAHAIARLQSENITTAFISKLGQKFMAILYSSLIAFPGGSVIVAVNTPGEIVGFVAGVNDTAAFYKYFLRNNFLKASFSLLPGVLSLDRIRKVFETLMYGKRTQGISVKAELLSIAVAKDYQKQGVGSMLVEGLISGFKAKGIDEFKVAAGSKIVNACRLYERMGGILSLEIEIHKGEKSRVYVWKL